MPIVLTAYILQPDCYLGPPYSRNAGPDQTIFGAVG